MKKNYLDILLLAGIIITLIGLITGRFLFLFLVIPIGLGFWNKKNHSKDSE